MKVLIRFSHNQMGMLIEARLPDADPKGDWQVVEMQRYTAFATRAYAWGQLSHVMSPQRQEDAYLAFLDSRGVDYEVAPHHMQNLHFSPCRICQLPEGAHGSMTGSLADGHNFAS